MAKNKTPEQQALEKEVKKQRKRVQQFVNRAKKRGYTFSENIVPSLPKKITEKTLSRFKKLTPEVLYQKAIYVSPEGTIIQGNVRRARERVEASQKAAITRRRYYEEQLAKERERYLNEHKNEIDEWFDYERDNPLWDDDLEEAWEDYQQSQQGYGPAPTPQSKLVLNNIRTMIENWVPRDIWSISLTELKKKDRDLLLSVLDGTIAREGEDVVAKRCEENAEELYSIVDRVLYDSGNSYKTRGVDGVNQDIQRFAQIIMGRSVTVRESMEFTEYGEQTGVYE